jgi:predicted nucleotidyltransferase
MFSLGSQITIKLLGYFFVNPEKRHYVNELADLLSLDPGNLSRKLKELEAEGILASVAQGNQKYYFLNKKYPLLNEVRKMFEAKYGVGALLKNELGKIKGLEKAYIFGSFAKDSLQQESDIDLLLVGSHSSFEAKRRLLPLQKAIGREINVVDMDRKEFDGAWQKKDPFIENIFSGKIIKLIEK